LAGISRLTFPRLRPAPSRPVGTGRVQRLRLPRTHTARPYE